MRGREPLVIGSVVAWVCVFWVGLCAFMLGWGPEDLTFGRSTEQARAPRTAGTSPSGPLDRAVLRHTLDS